MVVLIEREFFVADFSWSTRNRHGADRVHTARRTLPEVFCRFIISFQHGLSCIDLYESLEVVLGIEGKESGSLVRIGTIFLLILVEIVPPPKEGTTGIVVLFKIRI